MPDRYFNSRDVAFRSPTGAVEAQTRIHFRISLPRSLGCSGAFLSVKNDGDASPYNYMMFWCGMNGEHHEFWECHFTPENAGLYWYRFSLSTPDGPQPLGRGFGGEAVLGNGEYYQLTVYQKNFHTPDWLKGGVIYQIFPDRFAPSYQQKTNVPAGRKLRDDWGAQPEWKPDSQGKIRNDDYFGGDLAGITGCLDYLSSLGVTCLYLNPIFEAHSNHRYNTADYSKIDPLLGTEQDFSVLCDEARRRGIRIILDGVFSHTGSDSIYFNMENRYDSVGAYNSTQSPYYPWYSFHHWPDKYECWWGVLTLPEVNENASDFNRFINGPGGIVQKWLALGASGWRLDVADELPDQFLENLRIAAKSQKDDALILGEVWEDASSKESYGRRRKYLQGGQLDSVMNYPFRSAILGFLTGADARDMAELIGNLLENYPPQVIHLLMNHIGTHDTERAITILAGEPASGRGREWQSAEFLTEEQRERGLFLLRLAALLQYLLPGVPCVYYGDEAGMEGYGDPFNRGCYPWGNEDNALIDYYRGLGRLRKRIHCLKDGNFLPYRMEGRLFSFFRENDEDRIFCAINGGASALSLTIPSGWQSAQCLYGSPSPKENSCLLPSYGAVLLYQSAKPEA